MKQTGVESYLTLNAELHVEYIDIEYIVLNTLTSHGCLFQN